MRGGISFSVLHRGIQNVLCIKIHMCIYRGRYPICVCLSEVVGVCMHVHIYIYVYQHLRMYVHVCVCIYIYLSIYLSIYQCTNICMRLYTCRRFLYGTTLHSFRSAYWATSLGNTQGHAETWILKRFSAATRADLCKSSVPSEALCP